MNGGACGLIRQSACNLTNVLETLIVKFNRLLPIRFKLVLHGCRQFVL